MNVKQGDRARFVESIDGAAVGRIVTVVRYQGEHSKLGPVWRVRAVDGRGPLVTEYGGVSDECDAADEWLRVEADPLPAANDSKYVQA